MAEKISKDATVVATFDITHSGGVEKAVRTHEKAWALTFKFSPASAKFAGWARKEKDGKRK